MNRSPFLRGFSILIALFPAACAMAPGQTLPNPDMQVKSFIPADKSSLARGQTVAFQLHAILIPSPIDAIHYHAVLTVNGRDRGTFEFRLLPGGEHNGENGDVNMTWPVRVGGPRSMTVGIRLAGDSFIAQQPLQFFQTTRHYDVTCDRQEGALSNFFLRLFHRCR